MPSASHISTSFDENSSPDINLLLFGLKVYEEPINIMLKHAAVSFDDWPAQLACQISPGDNVQVSKLLSFSRFISRRYGFYPDDY